MKTLLHRLESISAWLGRSVSVLLLIMTLISVTVVLIRYVFESGSIALQESVTYLHACLFIMTAGYTLQNNGHVRVDIFYQQLSEKGRAWINLFGSLFLLLPFCLFSLWISFPYVQRSWEIGEKSVDAGGLPAVFLLKSLMIVLVLVLLFQALIETLRNIMVLRGELHNQEKEQQELI